MKINDRWLTRCFPLLAVAGTLLLPRPVAAQRPAAAALSPFAVQAPPVKPFTLGATVTSLGATDATQDSLPCWACVPRQKNAWYAVGESAVGLWAAWSFNAF